MQQTFNKELSPLIKNTYKLLDGIKYICIVEFCVWFKSGKKFVRSSMTLVKSTLLKY